MEETTKRWKHPGGKLRELGADTLSEAELLAILIGSGLPGKPAIEIARAVLERYGSLHGLASVPLEALLDFKGLGDVRIIRIAAALEIARRVAGDELAERD